mgnify:CR=1 FL=1
MFEVTQRQMVCDQQWSNGRGDQQCVGIISPLLFILFSNCNFFIQRRLKFSMENPLFYLVFCTKYPINETYEASFM